MLLRVAYDDLSNVFTSLEVKPTCRLPRAVDVLADPSALFAIKVDLRDVFFHKVPVRTGSGHETQAHTSAFVILFPIFPGDICAAVTVRTGSGHET